MTTLTLILQHSLKQYHCLTKQMLQLLVDPLLPMRMQPISNSALGRQWTLRLALAALVHEIAHLELVERCEEKNLFFAICWFDAASFSNTVVSISGSIRTKRINCSSGFETISSTSTILQRCSSGAQDVNHLNSLSNRFSRTDMVVLGMFSRSLRRKVCRS